MLRKPTPVEKNSGGGDARLLHDLETLSKALSFDPSAAKKAPSARSASACLSNPNPNPNPNLKKDSKKRSFWNWKPLRALANIRSRRFDCRFSLHVHSVDNLPQLFSGSTLIVHWKRTTDPASSSSSTRPVRVFGSAAEFEETLNYRCSVYGTRTGSNGSAKYESRHFLIWVSVVDSPGVDLGRNMVDLTRLLPLKLEELEEEENSSGKWSTSFRLSGKGKGASICVSFGFSLAGNGSGDGRSGGGGKMIRTRSVENVKELHEVLPSSKSPDFKDKAEGDRDPPEFMVIEKGKEIATDEPKLEKVEFEIEEETESKVEKVVFEIGEKIKTAASSEKIEKVDKEDAIGEEEVEKIDERVDETSNDNHVSDVPEGDGLLDVFSSLSILEQESQKSPRTELKTPCPMSYGEVKEDYKASGLRSKSLSLDDETVASEFLSMLGIEHSPFGLSSESDPESPRGQLWKQFKEESVNFGLYTGPPKEHFGLDMGSPMEPDWSDGDFAEDFDLSAIVHEAETELQKETQAMDSKSRARQMEDAETETLMRQWGLDEKAFQGSPTVSRSGFGSPIDLPPEELPPLCEGLGPLVQTKDGGFLRSMSPSLFKNAKNNGHLIMQVSSPVVVPAEMGSGIMEILQRLASLGIGKLSMQVKKLMPLEDVSGKTMQHLNAGIETAFGQVASGGNKRGGSRNLASSGVEDMASEYVSLEDLAPFAMDKIEALSIEGLRIQSGMSDEEAPSNISPRSIGEMSALEGKGTGGLQLMDVEGSGDDIDGLMGLSITLEEWMRLDSGIVDEEDEVSDRTLKVLAAHRARATDLITEELKGGGRRSGKRWGLLGNNFTVALMVQLRDPLRDYEPVGNPMLSLIQVERVFVPPKPKSTVSEKGDSGKPDEPETETELETNDERKEEEYVVSQFKITEVHISGLKTEAGKKKVWGNPVQQQSGSRWLLATGMGKSNKHPFMKSKAVSKPSPVRGGDTLWSISSPVHGNGAKWKELLALNPHIRNPNVVFPNETIRLK